MEDSLKKLLWLINKWQRYLTFQQLKKKRYRSLSYKKCYQKDQITGRDNLVWLIFEDPKKHNFLKLFQINLPKTRFFWSFDFIFNFFFKNSPEYINPSGHFVFYKILCSSNFLVEPHLGDVLEGLLGVGLKFVDNYHRKIHCKN